MRKDFLDTMKRGDIAFARLKVEGRLIIGLIDHHGNQILFPQEKVEEVIESIQEATTLEPIDVDYESTYDKSLN